jgi:hypothetical protein
LGDSVKKTFTYSANGNGYTTSLEGRFRVGAEYSFFDNKMSFGMLWQNAFGGVFLYDELTLSANFRPVYWFKGRTTHTCSNANDYKLRRN